MQEEKDDIKTSESENKIEKLKEPQKPSARAVTKPTKTRAKTKTKAEGGAKKTSARAAKPAENVESDEDSAVPEIENGFNTELPTQAFVIDPAEIKDYKSGTEADEVASPDVEYKFHAAPVVYSDTDAPAHAPSAYNIDNDYHEFSTVGSESAEDEEATVPHRKFHRKSVGVRTWFSFALLALFMIVFFWSAYALVFATSFEALKRRELIDRCEQVAVGMSYRDGWQLSEPSRDNLRLMNGELMVFTVDETLDGYEVSAELYVNAFGQIVNPAITDIFSEVLTGEFIVKSEKTPNVTTFRFDSNNYYAFGTYRNVRIGNVPVAEEQNVFVCIVCPFSVYDGSVATIQRVMIICSVIVFVVSIAFGTFISRTLTKPITGLSKDAQRLAEGDFSIRFDSKGYAEFDSLAAALNKAKDEMEKTEGMRRELLANVSHDLRTPLTMVKAYAESLRDLPYRNPEKHTEHAQIIIDEADKLTALVTDLLDLSRLQSGVYTPNPSLIRLDMLARDVTERFSIKTEQGYTFVKYFEEVYAYCDSRFIEQVIYNLVGNALNYAGNDKVVIVTAKEHNGFARFEVSDHGKGIKKEELATVWDRYYRSAQTKRAVVGTGLGLSICKSILTSHGARYGTISAAGKGTTFYFELPMSAPAQTDKQDKQE